MRIISLFIVLALVCEAHAQQPNSQESAVQGMTISCQGSGRSWGSDGMVETMTKLKAMGVNWITIHPYAGIRNDGRVASRLVGQAKAPTWISRPIKEAHKLGLKVMMKPHIAYWGSKFSWRGAIDFQDKSELKRFYDTYESWIVTMAKMSKDADAFVVGTELDRFVHQKERWQKIIKAVRKEYRGPLTYAANWSDFEKVSFWQDLDVIGIQAYFPVLAGEMVKGSIPKAKDVRAGWKRITQRMKQLHQETGKKICFTELGYNRSNLAPYKPWDYATGGEHAESIQELCMTEALRAIKSEPSIVGSFLWKCFPGKRQPRNFNMDSKTMRRTISEAWKQKSK